MKPNEAVLHTSLGDVTARAHGDLIVMRTEDHASVVINRVPYRLVIDAHCIDGAWKNQMIGKYGGVQSAMCILTRTDAKGGDASYAARDKARKVLFDALNSYVDEHPEFVDAGYKQARQSSCARLDAEIAQTQKKLDLLTAERAALNG